MHMEAIRRIEQVHGNSLTMVLPDAFKEMRVEVIVLPLDETVSTPGPHRQPHPDIAGKDVIIHVVSENSNYVPKGKVFNAETGEELTGEVTLRVGAMVSIKK